jgi:two-component system NtrC family response regulator
MTAETPTCVNDSNVANQLPEKQSPAILVVDDDQAILSIYELVLTEQNMLVTSCNSAINALELIAKQTFNLLLVDLRMPEMDGMELLRKALNINPSLQVIVITGHGTVESAVTAMKFGAFDYLAKPFLPDELLVTVQKALAFQSLAEENKNLQTALAEKTKESSLIVGSGSAISRLKAQIQAVAPTPATVLIRGESGSGKEVAADEIQRLSPRASMPYIKINCGAIPEHLLEDELFGHEKGAYTGASNPRKGKFEYANGGTILLDEIGEMPTLLQVKTLRILQEQCFQRLGSNKDIRCDVRIICSTNADLEAAVAEGRFREDLYYRLNVVELTIPALREHPEDIPTITQHFLKQLALQHAVPTPTITPEAMNILQEATWPGNIRELRNVLEHALIFSQSGQIGKTDIPERMIPSEKANKQTNPIFPQIAYKEQTLEEMELMFIKSALDAHKGNIVKTSKALNISRSTLYSKMKRIKSKGIGFD